MKTLKSTVNENFFANTGSGARLIVSNLAKTLSSMLSNPVSIELKGDTVEIIFGYENGAYVVFRDRDSETIYNILKDVVDLNFKIKCDGIKLFDGDVRCLEFISETEYLELYGVDCSKLNNINTIVTRALVVDNCSNIPQLFSSNIKLNDYIDIDILANRYGSNLTDLGNLPSKINNLYIVNFRKIKSIKGLKDVKGQLYIRRATYMNDLSWVPENVGELFIHTLPKLKDLSTFPKKIKKDLVLYGRVFLTDNPNYGEPGQRKKFICKYSEEDIRNIISVGGKVYTNNVSNKD